MSEKLRKGSAGKKREKCGEESKRKGRRKQKMGSKNFLGEKRGALAENGARSRSRSGTSGTAEEHRQLTQGKEEKGGGCKSIQRGGRERAEGSKQTTLLQSEI